MDDSSRIRSLFQRPAQREVRQEEGALPSGKSPFFAAGTGKNEIFLCRYLTITSTRRFLARPAAVLLLAIGLLSPWAFGR
jgi:hypothetical protein